MDWGPWILAAGTPLHGSLRRIDKGLVPKLVPVRQLEALSWRRIRGLQGQIIASGCPSAVLATSPCTHLAPLGFLGVRWLSNAFPRILTLARRLRAGPEAMHTLSVHGLRWGYQVSVSVGASLTLPVLLFYCTRDSFLNVLAYFLSCFLRGRLYALEAASNPPIFHTGQPRELQRKTLEAGASHTPVTYISLGSDHSFCTSLESSGTEPGEGSAALRGWAAFNPYCKGVVVYL